MIPATFEYKRADSLEHALALHSDHGEEVKILAGGHSLIPLLKLRLATPTILIDIGRVSELSYIREHGSYITIGALTTHDEINRSDLLKTRCPILAHTAGKVGDPQVRHRGTIGGSIAHGDPASDLPAVLLALDAELQVQRKARSRVVPCRNFFKGLLEVDLAADEILTEIRIPTSSAGWSYQKFHIRAQDWAIVGVAVVAGLPNMGTPALIGLATMGDVPLRALAVEEALAAGASFEDASRQVGQDTAPPSDQKASAEYRKALAEILTLRALKQAFRTEESAKYD